MRGRKSALHVALTPEEHDQLLKSLRCPSTPLGLARRCRAILEVAEGTPLVEVARLVGLTEKHVRKWVHAADTIGGKHGREVPPVGVLQRFEHRLEGMVEGAFARAFKSELQPVEIASAVQREMDDRAAIVAQGRTLVPNDFVVELAEPDYERLQVYADSLGIELATLAREHAREQGYSFVGPVRMRFEGVPDLTTGTFRIRSGVIRGTTVEDGEIRRPASDLPHPAGGFAGSPRLLVSGPEPGSDGNTQRTYELTAPLTILGRGTDCDLRLVDPGVSRHHAELRIEDGEVVLVDLGSTNGTFVNGQPVRRVTLTDGTRVTLGRTTLVFRRDGIY